MAVKKTNTKTKATEVESVEVENTEVEVEETPAVEFEVPEKVEVETPVNDVEVDTENTEVDNSSKPSGSVKIRMRVDHKCTIAMERYDLKAGKTYVVPENVKRILNNAGLLAPL